MDDAKMMDMFKGLLGGGADGESKGDGTDELFNQFSKFLSETESDDSMNGVLQSVVKDIMSKDSLYKPMKILKDNFPDWLEKNWESCS